MTHEPEPVRDSAYCEGPRFAGNRADLRNEAHYPVIAVCSCGSRLRRPEPDAQWAHAEPS